jgi:hypothetical protein
LHQLAPVSEILRAAARNEARAKILRQYRDRRPDALPTFAGPSTIPHFPTHRSGTSVRTPGEHRKTLNIGRKNIDHHRFIDLAVATALILVAIIKLLERINRAADFVR